MGFPQPEQSKILVIGETCIDRYIFGTCDRISPEAPVPVLNLKNTRVKNGMAANVASNIQSLGQQITIISNHTEILKTRYIDEKTKQHVLRVDENDACEEIQFERLKTILKNQKYDGTIISDYNKGFLSYDALKDIVNIVPKPIFVDTKKNDLSIFENCIIKINEQEEQRSYKAPLSSELIVTMGAKGAKYKEEILSTDPCDVIDVCGAGDTFISALAVHYIQFRDIRMAINFANRCARVVVQKTGVSNVSLDELR